MNKKIDPGVFVISLDFELHWGCFESMSLNDRAQTYFNNTRKIIPEMLELFASHQIHVTWATVGMLFCKNMQEWEENKPSCIPSYTNKEVSSYEWIQRYGFQSIDDPYHFAPEIIDLIKATPHQEIATHTYSHYYCLEKGQTKEQFREDLSIARSLSAKKDIQIKSLVFPRNQFNEDYLSVCQEMGISSVRSSPDIWYWEPSTSSTLMKKLFRAGDAYLKFQPVKKVYLKDIQVVNNLPILLPAVRLYRPWKATLALQNKLKLRRILNEMTHAAKKGVYYHLWWHPHNFGNHPEQCMLELKKILAHYTYLREKYDFKSWTMEETVSYLKGKDNQLKS